MKTIQQLLEQEFLGKKLVKIHVDHKNYFVDEQKYLDLKIVGVSICTDSYVGLKFKNGNSLAICPEDDQYELGV